MEDHAFRPFPKMARLSREIIVTEKIDGTNASIWISPDGQQIRAGSRTRWITPQDDNYGFAAWADAHRDELLALGPGHHFGEWWGKGINRGYELTERRFSLFNVARWALHGETPREGQQVLPPCVGLVPVLHRGQFDTFTVQECLDVLGAVGSKAARGFMSPEGVVVFHTAANVCFKKTLEKDGVPKSVSAPSRHVCV